MSYDGLRKCTLVEFDEKFTMLTPLPPLIGPLSFPGERGPDLSSPHAPQPPTEVGADIYPS
jgi:hypothetical protein